MFSTRVNMKWKSSGYTMNIPSLSPVSIRECTFSIVILWPFVESI